MNEQLIYAIVPPVVAVLIAGIRKLMPKLPKWAPLVLAPLLPVLANQVAAWSGATVPGTTVALLLGVAAVFCREVIDQTGKLIKPPSTSYNSWN